MTNCVHEVHRSTRERVKMKKLLQGDDLEKRAKELGVVLMGEDMPTTSMVGVPMRADDAELQRRVQEAERSIRESRLWLLALLSAISSIISAAAAWLAVLSK